MTSYALFFATLKRRAGRKPIGPKLFFERKIYDFPFKNNFGPKKPFVARLFSRRKKTVRNLSYILKIYFVQPLSLKFF